MPARNAKHKKPIKQKKQSAPAEIKKAPVSVKEATIVKSTQPTSPSEKLTVKKVISGIKKPQIYVPVAILLAVLVVFLLKGFFIAATVNGQLIFRPSLDSELEQQYGKQVMSSMITSLLVQQYAQSKGIVVSQSDMSAQIKQIDTQLASQGQTLDQALAARGMTMADFLQQIQLQDLLQKILAKQLTVTDKEVQQYIAANKSSIPQGQPQAQINAEVRQQLMQQKLTTQGQAFIQKLQSQAHITYFVNL